MLIFRALNTLTSYLNISKIRVLIQITLCRNTRIQMDLLKNNCLSAEEANNYIPHTEKRKKVPVHEMLEFSWSLSSSMIPILSWKLKMHTEAALRFLHHLSWSCFVNTKWLPLSQRLSKRLKLNEVNIYMFKIKDKGTRTRCEIYPELTIKAPR